MGILDRLFGGHHGRNRHGGHHGGHGNYGNGYGNGGPPPSGHGGIGCPSCNTLNAPGAKFCQQCGMSLVPAACMQCNTTPPPGAKFCNRCGAAIG
ncbi:MAG: double zinc ribbon domain-containing protein [Pseudomonadota bacterium]